MWQFVSYSPRETLDLGIVLGKNAPPGTVLALYGDLGAGKTLLAKGIAHGLQVEESITSPTFTIVNQYLSGRLPFNHMDIYRVQSEEELWEIGIEEYFDEMSLTVVEWPEMLGAFLPQDAISIYLQKQYDEEGNPWRQVKIMAATEKDTAWLEEALKDYAHIVH